MSRDLFIQPYYEIVDGSDRIDFSIVNRSGFWAKQKYSLDTEFIYWWEGFRPITCRKSSETGIYYDLFSVPDLIQFLTRRKLTNVMPGYECTFVHDDVCRLEFGTKEDRRGIFNEAYDVAMEQFYPNQRPDAWAKHIKNGVGFGSKYLGQC